MNILKTQPTKTKKIRLKMIIKSNQQKTTPRNEIFIRVSENDWMK